MTAPPLPATPGRRFPLITQFDARERGVLLPLCLVGFFTNYDTGLLTLAAPALADGLDVSIATFGIAVAVIRLAALGSIGTLRLADRFGRRPVLLASVLAFTLVTGLTAVAWTLTAFVILQMLARLFLATEETLSGVVLTEELRADRRGAGIGLLGILSTAGFGLVALLLLAVDSTPLGWRLFYVVALLPLAIVVYLRRNLSETTAYQLAQRGQRLQTSWWPDLDAEARGQLWRLLAVLGLVGALTTSAFFYAADLAQNDYGWTGLFTIVVFAAAPTTLLGYLVGGRCSDRYGRRPVTALAVLASSVGALLVFSGLPLLYAPGFFLMAGADAAVQAVRSVYASELFPTQVRATLASLAGVVIVVGGSVGLLLVGLLAPVLDPQATVLLLAAASAAGVVLLRGLPETAGTDVLGAAPAPGASSAG